MSTDERGYRIRPEMLVDVTRQLSPAVLVWKGDVPFSREVREENGFRISTILMGSHCGTHIDAPAHLRELSGTVDELRPSLFILPAVVIAHTDNTRLLKALTDGAELRGRALLLRTGGASCHMTAEAARTAVYRGVALIGTDSMSPDRDGCSEVHRILLGSSVPLVENLLLEDVRTGEYLFLCFPLRIEGGEGSPVRAFVQPLQPLD